MDDQLARVSAGEAVGACLVLNDSTEEVFSEKIRKLLDSDYREKMRIACISNHSQNGAVGASKMMIDFL
jgi:hypothetical protein